MYVEEGVPLRRAVWPLRLEANVPLLGEGDVVADPPFCRVLTPARLRTEHPVPGVIRPERPFNLPDEQCPEAQFEVHPFADHSGSLSGRGLRQFLSPSFGAGPCRRWASSRSSRAPTALPSCSRTSARRR